LRVGFRVTAAAGSELAAAIAGASVDPSRTQVRTGARSNRSFRMGRYASRMGDASGARRMALFGGWLSCPTRLEQEVDP
jgi:hypothetical protein